MKRWSSEFSCVQLKNTQLYQLYKYQSTSLVYFAHQCNIPRGLWIPYVSISSDSRKLEYFSETDGTHVAHAGPFPEYHTIESSPWRLLSLTRFKGTLTVCLGPRESDCFRREHRNVNIWSLHDGHLPRSTFKGVPTREYLPVRCNRSLKQCRMCANF